MFHKEFDINKRSESKECVLCHYWYFKNVGFKNVLKMDFGANKTPVEVIRESAFG